MSPAVFIALAVGFVAVFGAGVGVGIIYTVGKARKAARNAAFKVREVGTW